MVTHGFRYRTRGTHGYKERTRDTGIGPEVHNDTQEYRDRNMET